MVSKKSKKKKNIFLLFLIGKIRHGIGEKRWLFFIGNGAEIRPLEMGRKGPDNDRKYLVNLDSRCMVDRIYGTTSCGSHGFREDCFNFSSF